jgi:hypothetical protein
MPFAYLYDRFFFKKKEKVFEKLKKNQGAFVMFFNSFI